MDFFQNVIPAPVDPIFGINIAFALDQRKNKLNASVGTYKDENLAPYILPCVKVAEGMVLQSERSKEYLPIGGDPDYLRLTSELVFGHGEIPRVCGIQALGGTGALRLAGDLLHHGGIKRLYVGDPTWGNHQKIYQDAGLDVIRFPHQAAMSEAIGKMIPRSGLLLQASCHNPTGLDPSNDQWKEIVKLVRERELFVIFDLAYQGFGEGLIEDTFSIRLFMQEGLSFAVAVSHSKNFGLYAERIGALYVACTDQDKAAVVVSRLKAMARGVYSNPPCHGARIISTILLSSELRAQWVRELDQMRQRVQMIRNLLASELEMCFAKGKQQFREIRTQKGMFAFPGITPELVLGLKEKHAIYLTGDGRINLAGLNPKGVKELANALATFAVETCADDRTDPNFS